MGNRYTADVSGRSKSLKNLVVFLAIWIVAGFPARGDTQVITDFVHQFDGSEATAVFPGNCGGAVTGYQVAGPIRTVVTGDYNYKDASVTFPSGSSGIDMYLNIYEGAFDPSDTNSGLVTGFDDIGTVTLNSGVDYFLVVEELCGAGTSTPGIYAFSLIGPSEITGGGSNPDSTFRGTFDGSEPVAITYVCEPGLELVYDAIGPVTVTVSGDYLFHDVSLELGVDMTLAVYQGQFDPAEPGASLVGVRDDDGPFALIADEPYVLVAQPLCENYLGIWDFMLIGPGLIEDLFPPVLFADGFE
jgi:hypothetical protein